MNNNCIENYGQNISSVNDFLIRLASHYTDSYASDIVIHINSIERQLESEGFQNPHIWYFGFYKSGVQREDAYEEFKKLDTRSYRAIYKFALEIVTENGFKEPKITVVREENH